MSIALALFGVVLLFFGFMLSSQATAGVFLAASACYVGILARLAQAHDHELRRAARETRAQSAVTPSV